MNKLIFNMNVANAALNEPNWVEFAAYIATADQGGIRSAELLTLSNTSNAGHDITNYGNLVIETPYSILGKTMQPSHDHTAGYQGFTIGGIRQLSRKEGSPSIQDNLLDSKRFANMGDKVVIACQPAQISIVRQNVDIDEIFFVARRQGANTLENDVVIIFGKSRINEDIGADTPILINEGLPARTVFIVDPNSNSGVHTCKC